MQGSDHDLTGQTEFGDAFRLASAPMLLLAPETGRVLASNAAFRAAIGTGRDWIASGPFAALLTHPSAVDAGSAMRRAIDTGTAEFDAVLATGLGGGPRRALRFRLRRLPGPPTRLLCEAAPETGPHSTDRDAAGVLEQLRAAVETLPDGFVLYDRDDRLVLCNEKYREFYAESPPALVPGARFEGILRFGLERGQYAAALGREEDWLAERMRAHRAATSHRARWWPASAATSS